MLVDDRTAAVVPSETQSLKFCLPDSSIEYWFLELAKPALSGLATAHNQDPKLIALNRAKTANYRFAARMIDPNNAGLAPFVSGVEQREIEQKIRKYAPFRVVLIFCWAALQIELAEDAPELDSPEKVCAAVMTSGIASEVCKAFGAQSAYRYDWLINKCMEVARKNCSENTPSLTAAYQRCNEAWMQLSREENLREQSWKR